MGERPTVVEQTGKGWKALQLFGALAVVAAVPACVACTETGGTETVGLGVGTALFVVGFGCFVAGRIGAWWYHG